MTDEASRPDPAADPAVPKVEETPVPDTAQTPVPATARGPVGRPATRALFVLAILICVADLVTKVLAVHYIDPADPISIIGDTVTLTLVRNPGAAFSMATGMTWLLTLVAIGVVIGVVKIGRTLQSRWWALGLGLVLGGALGNLTDRLFRSPGPLQGHVVDFVSVGWWPVFNVADSSIVCGAVLLVVLTVFGIEPTGKEPTGKEPTESETSGKETRQ
ncbi:signal peptidase II [Rhodococcus coprophilus]|uniref:signal peptidase II n=1 Tax=Rhodococcus coprophilus TaxID=38310 RepID=UPI003F4CC54F